MTLARMTPPSIETPFEVPVERRLPIAPMIDVIAFCRFGEYPYLEASDFKSAHISVPSLKCSAIWST
jgi:hypothetical protein